MVSEGSPTSSRGTGCFIRQTPGASRGARLFRVQRGLSAEQEVGQAVQPEVGLGQRAFSSEGGSDVTRPRSAVVVTDLKIQLFPQMVGALAVYCC